MPNAAMRKFSAYRKSSVFTIDTVSGTGWETDIHPRQRKRQETLATQQSLPAGNYFQRRFADVYLRSNNKKSKPAENFRSRLLLKTGLYNILGKNIPDRKMRFFTDFWNTLVDLRWAYVFFFFLFTLISSWLFFATIFYLIAFAHGDLHAAEVEDFSPCFANFQNFASAFLYSIETMHTIGYGHRYTTESCATAIIFMCVSVLVGCALEACIVGVVFAKFQTPAQRAQTLLFSTNAVVSSRDGHLVLLFRVGNVRKSLIIQLAIRAHLVHHRLTSEGELMPFHQHEIVCKLDSMSGNAFSLWPVTACHKIDRSSPLYELNKESLKHSKFEIIITLEGIVENTGSVLQARTSYTPQEIIWGHSFTGLLTYRKERGQYVVDFNHFQKIEPVKDMLDYSARELEQRDGTVSAPEFDNEEVVINGRSRTASDAVDCVPPRHRSESLNIALSILDVGQTGTIVEEAGSLRSARRRKSSQRRFSNVEKVEEIFKPPSPSLARAVSASAQNFGVMQTMARDYERKMSRQQNAPHDGEDVPQSSHGLHMRSRMSVSSPDMRTKRRLAMIESASEPIVELEMEESSASNGDEVTKL